MPLVLVTAPTEEPVTLAELWKHLRIDASGSPLASDFDDELTLKLRAAREDLDGQGGSLGRALCTQTWDLVLDQFPDDDFIKIPLPPLQSVTHVKYFDGDLVEQTLDASLYDVDTANQPGWVAIGTGGWPTTAEIVNAVTIRFVAGYGDAADVPFDIKASLLLKVESMFDRNKDADRLEQAADRLLFKRRVFAF